MRILFSSHVFAPSVGGIEKVSELLAAEFVRQGHEVRLVTQTAASGPDEHEFAVYRRPSMAKLFKLLRWCDVYFHSNISLPRAWPLLFVSRPWVVAHHVWIPQSGLAGRMKRFVLRYARGISISRAIADHLATPSTVVPNPYDDSLFSTVENAEDRRDLVFVGRLVSDKGADLLLSAVARLAMRGVRLTTTIIGAGPEAPALKAQAESLGIADSVVFAGVRRGRDLVQSLNEHRLLVVPSLWQEPFGLVALEGIACGCIPVGSAGGGLAEAIGACGETFPNGDVGALTDVLERLLRDPTRQAVLRNAAAQHLRRHSRATVAAEYLQVFREAMAAPGESIRVRDVFHV